MLPIGAVAYTDGVLSIAVDDQGEGPVMKLTVRQGPVELTLRLSVPLADAAQALMRLASQQVLDIKAAARARQKVCRHAECFRLAEPRRELCAAHLDELARIAGVEPITPQGGTNPRSGCGLEGCVEGCAAREGGER